MRTTRVPTPHAPIALLAAAALTTLARAQTAWTGATNSNWSTATNWNPAAVPNSSTAWAALGDPPAGAYEVVYNSSVPAPRQVRRLSITNPDVTLRINPGNPFNIAGSIDGGLLEASGLIIVGDGSTNDAILRFPFDSTQLNSTGPNGRIVLFGQTSDDARFQSTSATGPIIGPTMILEGRGRIEGPVRNTGTIATSTNPAIMTGPRIIGAVTQSGAGKILAAVGDVSIDFPGSITGGALETSGTGTIYALGSVPTSAAANINDVTNLGNFKVAHNGYLRVTNALNNAGDLTVNHTAGNSDTVLHLNAAASLHGPGPVILNSNGINPSTAQLRTGPQDQATLGPTAIIRGQGYISGNLINQGTIGDGPGFGPQIRATIIQQNSGKLSAGHGAAVSIDTQGAVIGGTLETSGSGVVYAHGLLSGAAAADVTDVTNLGAFKIVNNGYLRVTNSLNNSGTLTVNHIAGNSDTVLQLNLGATLNGPGAVVLNSNGTNPLTAQLRTSTGSTDQATIGDSAIIAGRGSISGNLIFRGTLAPGGLATIGQLSLRANPLAMTATAITDIDLGGPTPLQRDSLIASTISNIQLQGTLRIRFIDDYLPSPCAFDHVIIQGGTITGSFTNIEQPAEASGLFSVVIQGSPPNQTLRLLYMLPSDFNGDGDFGTDSDIETFFACLAGNCCPTCRTSDFNGDGDFGTDADIEAFFRVLAGGEC